MSFKEDVLKSVEVVVEQLIEKKSDELVDLILAKLTSLIPGNFDNMLAEANAPKIKEYVKAELLKAADKIDGTVA